MSHPKIHTATKKNILFNSNFNAQHQCFNHHAAHGSHAEKKSCGLRLKRYRAVTLGVVLNVIIIKVMLDRNFM
jgi:hypothetical protein